METPANLAKMQISHLFKFAESFKGIEVHLLISGKYVKLNYSEDHFVEILRKLQQKEVTEVYIRQEDCKKILGQIQNSMSASSFYDPSTLDERRIENTEAAMRVVKELIKQLGPDPETVKLLTTINTRAMGMLSESPSLHSFIKRFKKNCTEEFLRTMMTSYLMSLVIDKFPWKSDLVKEKGALASILCDMLLEKEDFNLLRAWESEGGDLPEKIKQHPIEVVKHLSQRRNLIPSETLTIIEQHHELPDGKGFPIGINATRFNQLSCIFIISQQFIEGLFLEGFNFERRLDIISRLQKKYPTKNFERAIDALIAVVDTDATTGPNFNC